MEVGKGDRIQIECCKPRVTMYLVRVSVVNGMLFFFCCDLGCSKLAVLNIRNCYVITISSSKSILYYYIRDSLDVVLGAVTWSICIEKNNLISYINTAMIND